METGLLIIFTMVMLLDIISNFFFCWHCKEKKDITEAQNEMLKELLRPWVDKEDKK